MSVRELEAEEEEEEETGRPVPTDSNSYPQGLVPPAYFLLALISCDNW